MIAFARAAAACSDAPDRLPCAGAPNDAAPLPGDGRARQARAERLGDGIARLGAHLDAALYRQLVLIREFDALEGWHLQGFRSCAAWLSWRIGLAPGAARERVRVARALEPLPLLSDALRRGRLSYSAARALTRVATPETEAELVEVARHTTAAELEKLVRGWRALDRASEETAERARHEQRGLSLVPDPDGSWAVRGRLDPEVGAEADRALACAEAILRAHGVPDPDATPRQRRADAFALLIEAALGGGLGALAEAAAGADGRGVEQGGGRAEADRPDAQTDGRRAGRPRVVRRADRCQVVVHVSAETLRAPAAGTGESAARAGESAEGSGDGSGTAAPAPGESRIEGGPRVSAETARRLACDAGLVVMAHDGAGTVLDVGRKTRSVPTALGRALDRRDGGCRFPGCGLRLCDAHHVHHWADGGETKLDNLALLCRWHHRRVHEDGWRMELGEGGEARFYRPDGRLLPAVPPRPEIAQDPVGTLEREQRPLGIDPWTPTTRWLGDPLDLDWALFTLWRPPAEPAPGSARPGSGVSAETPRGRVPAET